MGVASDTKRLVRFYEKALATIASVAVERLQNSGYEVKFHDL
nr:hypothetical protein [uncultured Campylobacter sp.]